MSFQIAHLPLKLIIYYYSIIYTYNLWSLSVNCKGNWYFSGLFTLKYWLHYGPHIEKDEEELQAFSNDPSLQKWYKELPKSKEEDLRLLRNEGNVKRKQEFKVSGKGHIETTMNIYTHLTTDPKKKSSLMVKKPK